MSLTQPQVGAVSALHNLLFDGTKPKLQDTSVSAEGFSFQQEYRKASKRLCHGGALLSPFHIRGRRCPLNESILGKVGIAAPQASCPSWPQASTGQEHPASGALCCPRASVFHLPPLVSPSLISKKGCAELNSVPGASSG